MNTTISQDYNAGQVFLRTTGVAGTFQLCRGPGGSDPFPYIRYVNGVRSTGGILADIADLLGHKDLATTQIYAKVQQEHLRTVVGKLTGLVPAPEIDGASHKRVTHDDQSVSDSQKLLETGELGRRHN